MSNQKSQDRKKQKSYQSKKILEQLGELTNEAVSEVVSGAGSISENIIKQVIGQQTQEKGSIDLEPGKVVYLNKENSNQKVPNQEVFFKEIQKESQKKLDQIRIKLHVLMQEAVKMTKSMGRLSEQTKLASFQAPTNPGEYHIAFIQNLIEYIKTFRKKIDSAASWLIETNKRTDKKNYWAQYKKHGASFLLSGEHYIARSAG